MKKKNTTNRKPVSSFTVESFGADNFAIRTGNYYEDGLSIDACVGILARMLIVSNEIQKMDQFLVTAGHDTRIETGRQKKIRVNRAATANS